MQERANTGNIIRIGAIAVPWLCAVVVPILTIGTFYQDPIRILFFDFVMVPFSNIAIIGATLCDHDNSIWQIVPLCFTGIILPPALAILFVRYWKRWQFALVWLCYVALIAWDAIVASVITVIISKSGHYISWL